MLAAGFHSSLHVVGDDVQGTVTTVTMVTIDGDDGNDGDNGDQSNFIILDYY